MYRVTTMLAGCLRHMPFRRRPKTATGDRCRFQFGLRAIFVFTTVCALLCAWIVAGFREAQKQQAAVEALTGRLGRATHVRHEEDYHGHAFFSYRMGEGRIEGAVYDGLNNKSRFTPWWNSRRWLAALTGNARYQSVVELVAHAQQGKVTDGDWKLWLTSFPYVRDVLLSGLKDEQFVYLAKMQKLEFFWLEDASITGEGLQHLRNLPDLRTLQLESELDLEQDLFRELHFSEDGKAQLGMLTQLRRLRITADDGLLPCLADLSNLIDLDLSRAPITDCGMIHVGKMTLLRRLDLSRTRISDSGLKQVEPLRNLEALDLSGTRITDAGIACVMNLPRLRVLTLPDATTDLAVPDLLRMNGLDVLDLRDTQITFEGQRNLRRGLARTHVLGRQE